MSIFQNTFALDNIFYTSNYNHYRRQKLMLFGTLFNEYPEFINLNYNDRNKLLQDLERSIYNTTIDKAQEENIITSWEIQQFLFLYDTLCYKISSNIDKNGLVKNVDLAKLIIDRQIDLKQLPKCSNIELFKTKYEDILTRLNRSKNVSQTYKYSTMYVCRKCKKSQTRFEVLQNRSADEGNNYSVTCLNCNNQFHA
jgi:DNA-directed RNA polymerase subunit M/transcription elongation factor TFIIS